MIRTCRYLETLVLKDFFDSNLLLLLWDVEETGGEDDAKGAIANDLAVRVLDLLWLARLAIRGYDLYDFVWVIWVADGVHAAMRWTRGGKQQGVRWSSMRAKTKGDDVRERRMPLIGLDIYLKRV